MLDLLQPEGNGELGRGTESQASKYIKGKACTSERAPKLTATGQENFSPGLSNQVFCCLVFPGRLQIHYVFMIHLNTENSSLNDGKIAGGQD